MNSKNSDQKGCLSARSKLGPRTNGKMSIFIKKKALILNKKRFFILILKISDKQIKTYLCVYYVTPFSPFKKFGIGV